jgi:hypothetical protein
VMVNIECRTLALSECHRVECPVPHSAMAPSANIMIIIITIIIISSVRGLHWKAGFDAALLCGAAEQGAKDALCKHCQVSDSDSYRLYAAPCYPKVPTASIIAHNLSCLPVVERG